jgi:hypothetical protein
MTPVQITKHKTWVVAAWQVTMQNVKGRLSGC